MEIRHERHRTADFWQSVGAALAAFARQSGFTLRESPLPELREVARDLDEPPGPSKIKVGR